MNFKLDINGFPETKPDDAYSIEIQGLLLFMKNRHKHSEVRPGGIMLAVADTVLFACVKVFFSL